MYTLNFDCRTIHNYQDFYHQLTLQYNANYQFGDSLDALWDWLTGELPLPLTLNFCNAELKQFSQGQPLATIVALVQDAQRALPHQIVITYGQHTSGE